MIYTVFAIYILYLIGAMFIYLKYRKQAKYMKKFLHISYATWFIISFYIIMFFPLILLHLDRWMSKELQIITLVQVSLWIGYFSICSGLSYFIPIFRKKIKYIPIYIMLGFTLTAILMYFTTIDFINNGGHARLFIILNLNK